VEEGGAGRRNRRDQRKCAHDPRVLAWRQGGQIFFGGRRLPGELSGPARRIPAAGTYTIISPSKPWVSRRILEGDSG
jgi:hypothetical protein